MKTFEQAYKELESIVNKIHSNTLELEEALALYEQADTLITLCEHHLQHAETKINTFIKNRQGTLECDEQGQPLTQPFAL